MSGRTPKQYDSDVSQQSTAQWDLTVNDLCYSFLLG